MPRWKYLHNKNISIYKRPILQQQNKYLKRTIDKKLGFHFLDNFDGFNCTYKRAKISRETITKINLKS